MNFADAFHNFIKGVNSFRLVEQVPVKSAIIISLLLMAFIFALFVNKIYKSDVSNFFIFLLIVIFFIIENYVIKFIIFTTAKTLVPAIIFLIILFLIAFNLFSLFNNFSWNKLKIMGVLIVFFILTILISIAICEIPSKDNQEQGTNESEDTFNEIEGFQ